ncbi:MAG: class I SAM-dependent methyltransferase [Leptospirales bacterium]|nr:class I SAM-dependent methyltransferase [Leptospirales bacterium]
MSQDQIFATSESDQWFTRNRAVLDTGHLERDLPLKLFDMYQLRPASVLEIGSANGYRLEAIRTRCNCEVTGVEPSSQAIADGQSRYPAIKFIHSTAAAIPIIEKTFDLVIVNFVLHWIDRSTLMRSIAEIDRLLADGGHLILGDFSPETPGRVGYRHLPDGQVYTFKQQYDSIFIASGLYHLVARLTGNVETKQLDPDVDGGKRMGVSLLKKSFHENYVFVEAV